MTLPVSFPAPYPDEVLYSILCRYHVRSCNQSDNTTLHQLFDKKRSLHTTVLSPFPLRFASQWTDSFHGLSREALLLDHTAFPFYRAFYNCSNASRSSYAADRFFMAMYNNCCTTSKRLRFCPKCAQAQWQHLGVSYWQVLPQINGFEICPIHQELIRETHITHWDIRYNFYPASDELGNPKTYENHWRTEWILKHQKDFLQAALDISFLFRFSYYGFHLGAKIQKVLQYDLLPIRHYWIREFLNDPVAYYYDGSACLEALAALARDQYQLISQLQYVPALLQLRLCRAMFGDLEEFCNASI